MYKESYFFSARVFRWGIALILLISIVHRLVSETLYFDPEFYVYDYEFDLLRANYALFLGVYLLVVLSFAWNRFGLVGNALLYLFFVFDFLLRMPIIDWGDWVLMIQLFLYVPVGLHQNPRVQQIAHRLLRCHIVFILGVNGIRKLLHWDWLNGSSVVYFADIFKHVERIGLYETISAYPYMAAGMGWSVIAVQSSSVIVFFSSSFTLRWVYLMLLCLVHVLTGLVIGLWDFQFVVIFSALFLIPDSDWRRIPGKSVSL